MKSSKISEEIREKFNINHIYAHNVAHFISSRNMTLKETENIIKEKPKPFVKWVGGKRQLLEQFKQQKLYPPEKFNIMKGKYFEPFVGGGAVFFDLLPHTASLSDLNLELVITYNVIKNDVTELIKSLKKHKYNKEYFLKIRSQDTKKLSDIQIASRFIYLNRTCFNGMFRVNSRGFFNVPFGKYSSPLICDEENLKRVSKALKNVKITCQDYKKSIKKAKKGDFIYFDPPYFPINKTSSFTSYTKESFLEKEQIELRDTFLKLHKKGCYVMLSNSDTDFIKKIYSKIHGIKIQKVKASRTINSKVSGRGKIEELLIINY